MYALSCLHACFVIGYNNIGKQRLQGQLPLYNYINCGSPGKERGVTNI